MATAPLDTYDVLIVGFGPCGQVMAAQLGQLGHDVGVFERSNDPYPLPRAGHVDDEIVRVFQDIGAADEFEVRAVTPRGYEWLSATGELLFMIDWNRPTDSTWRSDYIFYQPYLEQALTDAATRHPRISVHRGWEVVEIVDRGDHFDVLAKEGDRSGGQWATTGRERTVSARYVIGADGARSVVRSAVGIEFTDFGFQETLSIVDVRLHDPDLRIEMPDAGQICDPVRPVSLFRWLGREHCRWEFMLMPGEDPAELVSEESSWDKLARWGVNPGNATMIRRTLYTFASLICDTFRRGRVLLVGDAAHLMPPFLGQGMCSGVRDVANLVWKLDLVLRGIAGDTLLDTYTAERRPHVAALTQIAIDLGKVLCETDPAAAAARDEALLAGLVPPTPPLPGLAHGVLFRTPDGFLGPLAGARSVQGRVTYRGETGRFDDVVGRGWIVLTRAAGLVDRLADDDRKLLQRLGARVVHITKATMPAVTDSVMDRDGGYDAQFRAAAADVVVIRPDHYIFGAAAEADLAAFLGALHDQLELSDQLVRS